LEPIVGCHPQETTNNQVRLEKRKIIPGWEFFGVGRGRGERERERERGAMHALRTLFISCVRKVGEYNKECFHFKKFCHLIINIQSENDGWLAGWMDGLDWIDWMDGLE